MSARAATIAAVLALILTGCGGEGDDTLGEDAVRNCLADNGLGAKPPRQGATGIAPYLSAAPDFRAYSADGAALDVIVQGSDEKAERTAANISGSLQTFGVADSDERLMAKRNVVAVFDESPSAEDRKAVLSCLD